MHPIPAAVFTFALAASLAACSYRPTLPTLSIPNAVKPYKAEVVQGNFVSSEQVAALRAGMPRQQVRQILGTPLLTDVFHANRWDYIFTIERDGVLSKALRLTVYFNGEQLERWEGDAMPSEAEFVEGLASGRKIGKIPPLTATDKALAEFAARENSKTKAAPAPSETTANTTTKAYPPLESK
jgi:outer membrane protein assembly factor BamE